VTHSVVCHKSPLFFIHAFLLFPGSLALSAAHAQKSVSIRDKRAVLHLSIPCISTNAPCCRHLVCIWLPQGSKAEAVICI